jgi:hypothetical protein
MLEGVMAVPDIFEEVDLVLASEQRSADGMDRGIAPPFVVEPTLLVKVLKEFAICLSAPEIEVANFEVGPNYITISLI